MEKKLLILEIEKNKSISEIAEHLNVSVNSIRYYMKKYVLTSKYIPNIWRKDNLKPIIEDSYSYYETLRKLKLQEIGENYYTLKKYIERYEININHFYTKELRNIKYSDKEIFIKDSPVKSRSAIRNRVKKNDLIEYKCSNKKCPVDNEWLGTPITLHLDHINGDKKDNRLENLRYLCPNCHQQTNNWGTKNRKKTYTSPIKGKKKGDKEIETKKCLNCDKKFELKHSKQKFCSIDCVKSKSAENIPNKEELIEVLKEKNGVFLQVGRYFNVSDNGIRKWCKKYNIPHRSREIKEFLKNAD